MNQVPSPTPYVNSRFWERFLDIIHKQGIKEPFDRWYVIRAQEYLKAVSDKPLTAHEKQDAIDYLQELGRNGVLKDWQFRQVVSALEVMLRYVLMLPWAERFEWEYWRNSARSLQPNHATIAREAPISGLKGKPPGSTRQSPDASQKTLQRFADSIDHRDPSARLFHPDRAGP